MHGLDYGKVACAHPAMRQFDRDLGRGAGDDAAGYLMKMRRRKMASTFFGGRGAVHRLWSREALGASYGATRIVCAVWAGCRTSNLYLLPPFLNKQPHGTPGSFKPSAFCRKVACARQLLKSAHSECTGWTMEKLLVHTQR